MKSKKNKTLDLPLEACGDALETCLFPTAPLTAGDCRDRVLCGDFFEIAPLLPEKSFDLLIVDPPYNLRKDYGGEVFSKKNAAAYGEFTRRWLTQIKRLARDTASVYVCCDWETGILLAPALEEFFTVRSRITWQREKGRGAAKNWKNCLEDVWFCTVSDDYRFNLDAVKQVRKVKAPYRSEGAPKDWEETPDGKIRSTCPSNFWDDITVPFWSMAENTAHPTQKPEKLLAKLILASSSAGDAVFDPFGGAGTTAVTAKKLGRHFTVVEKNPQYCAWTQLRLQRADTDKHIQGFENGVFFKNQ
ncbi:MAG: site-specific DNA-methyltransferase [Clostridia bacterium]|nr:site-specific DNA-methyltransferase [Clostridia bacterium]